MRSHAARGFSLIEMCIALVILGMLFAFSIPAVNSFNASYKRRGAAEDIAGQLRLAREKAIATSSTQTLRFTPISGADYYVWNGATGNPSWKLPNGITYYTGTGTYAEYRMSKDGRSLDSGMIVVQDTRGIRDTVSVQLSGLVLVQ